MCVCVPAVCQCPALATVWQQCCSDSPLVRSACCDAVVLLVHQGHADLHYVLDTVLNLLPSARYMQNDFYFLKSAFSMFAKTSVVRITP